MTMGALMCADKAKAMRGAHARPFACLQQSYGLHAVAITPLTPVWDNPAVWRLEGRGGSPSG